MQSNPIEHLLRPRPQAAADAKAWVDQEDLLALLSAQRGPHVLLYAAGRKKKSSFLLHSAVAPAADVDALLPEQLSGWDSYPTESWRLSLVTSADAPLQFEFGPSCPEFDREPLYDAQPLVFHRHFDGRAQNRSYIELAQFFIHAHDLHWTPERNAYCHFKDGDVEDVITVHESSDQDGDEDSAWVFIRREALERHLAATDTILLQMFDSTRYSGDFPEWIDDGSEHYVSDNGRHYRACTSGDTASYFRGTQVIRPAFSTPEYAAHLFGLNPVPRKYETFLVHDIKNDRLAEVSCAPDAMASYFDGDSQLPLEMSPVFFNAAVLDRYKADPEKYTLTQRSISCRQTWDLQTYHFNEAGQVHTYLIYLGHLPYTEQLYWKSCNEAPKGSISERARTTDFEGRFDTEPEPLRDLVHAVQAIHESRAPWFRLRDSELLNQLHYPLTASVKAWGEAVKMLTMLVVEGLEHAYIKRKALELGASDNPQMRSIGWTQELLRRLELSEESVTSIIRPLRETQELRSILDAHAGGHEAKNRRARLLDEHGSPRKHIERLCSQLLTSLTSLRTELEPKAGAA